MFEDNNVQNNFNKQMNESSREREYNVSLESNTYSNPYSSDVFYGQTNLDNKKPVFDKLKKFFSSKIVLGILFVLFILFLGTIKDSSLEMVKAYDDGNFDEAIKYCDKILSKKPNDFNALVYKGYSLALLGDYEAANEYLKKAETIDYDLDLYLQIGYINYEMQEYDEAISYLDKVIDLDSRNLDAYMFKGYSLVELQRYDEADSCAEKIRSIYGDNPFAYNILGLTQNYRENYDEAVENFEKAIKFYEDDNDSLYQAAYINKAWALYNQQSYAECIEFCNSVKSKFPECYDFPYYMGDCYSILGEHEKAILAYEEAIKIYPNDSTLFSRIAFEYYYLEDYDKATAYVEKSLELYSEDFEAVVLKDMLVEAKKPENERIVNFVKKNYLYFDQVKDFDQKAAAFLEKKELTLLDIYDFIESVKIKDDMFTYLIFDEYYDMLMEEELNNSIEHKVLSENVQYLKINSFTSGIDHQFKSILRKLPNPQEQILVIDLRDNPGGLSSVANNMLDFLLPECVTSYLVDRAGEIYTYNSDKNQMIFKHIYIFVNEESASSSELLTLGLKTYLNNVTVIGRPTVGKGVGQTVFESKKNKYMIFLVNTYWNIKEKNITEHKIQPDIKVKGNELSSYIDAINKHISNNK